ncbi:MAG: hypothetical protein IKN41_01290 [Candidatus Methanomethylophilaceae archaeon]|nr:hypothetical protein [Candidatus Methanomethylophilaceae archaeon]
MEVLGLDVPLDAVSPFLEYINGLCFILNGAFYDQSAPGIRPFIDRVPAEDDLGLKILTVVILFQK